MAKKILKNILLISILVFVCFSFLLMLPGTTYAFDLQVKIPGLNEAMIQPDGTTRPIGEYVKAIYVYATSIVGILATVVMMFGGVIWMTAYGNASRVGEAKAWIGAALTGLVLTMTSYMIMQTINPALVNLETSEIPSTQEILLQKYDDGILKRQIGDASPELLELINCVLAIPKEKFGIQINSISDDRFIGYLTVCDQPSCPGECQHKCQSCHYGGGLGTNKSYAIDVDSTKYPNDMGYIVPEIMNKCGQYIGFTQDKKTYAHFSVKACPKN